MKPFSSTDYLLEDWPRTLFPMGTTRHLVQHGAEDLFDYIYKKALFKDDEAAFLTQTLCFAAKADFHLRRTLKLDPFAELFLYDVVLRNRKSVRGGHQSNRKSYGYHFKEGRPASPMSSYRVFRKDRKAAEAKYRHSLFLDVALYFNSVYHHDIVSHFSDCGWAPEDVEHLGQYLRQINAGRSVDCLPQGLNPSKVIGSEFLRFVDNSAQLRSPLFLRFLDDMVLFSDSEADLTADLLTIQELLGAKGLSLNTAKTRFQSGTTVTVEDNLDEIKVSLLRIRQEVIEVSGKEREIEITHYDVLNDEQTEYLLALLRNNGLDEADAELILTLLTEHGDEVLAELGNLLARFPALAKTMYAFLGKLHSRHGLASILLGFLNNRDLVATEYQLFWLAVIAESFLSEDPTYGDVLMGLYNHRFATPLTQARVLEIADNRFGLPELRASLLRSGQSNWLAWASAVGCREQSRQSRNQALSYFGNASPINRVVAGIVAR